MNMQNLHPFIYDVFQQQAIDAIERNVSIFVSAPTGSGKTVIADYAIRKALQNNQQVIYTSPVKALSNQKFRDFSARDSELVGIMTGDVTINPNAPIVIMTTEIYRNTLLEQPTRLNKCGWIIFDEIHYLDDPDRGTVWEESILFTPKHINILALSATIPNAEELASWIRQVHERPVEVIVETKRPVPLHTIFQCQNKIITSNQDLKYSGYQGREDWSKLRYRVSHRGYRQEKWQASTNRLDSLIRHLSQESRLPCIFFTFGRRRTEDLAWEASGINLISDEERKKLNSLFDELCSKYQITNDRSIEALFHLIDKGIAYHHAGMLPTVKEVIEQCFASRLVKLIFTTETFALGINMPARSVVIDSLKKRIGGHSDIIRSREFSQMAGRAGRRGMDEAGFAYLRVSPTLINYPEVMRVLHNKPEPVQSRLNTGYATLLNLYRRHGRRLLDFFPQTFYYFQTSGKRRDEGLSLMQRKLDLLERLGYINKESLTLKGEFASWLYGYELLLTELNTQGHLENLDPPSLAVLLSGVVYEPRPGLRLPKSNELSKKLNKICESPLEKIHQAEQMFKIKPKTKPPHFQLAGAIESWFHAAPFAKLSRLCEVDDGEIVRYFRMTVQLLRQLTEAPSSDANLKRKARIALNRINRDVVDAEQQLRLG
jgi:superfamily II RNA helicase